MKENVTLLQHFPKDCFAVDANSSKCLHATSSNVLFCTHYVGNMIYHNFSHSDVSHIGSVVKTLTCWNNKLGSLDDAMYLLKLVRPNKNIHVFRVTGLEILGRVGTALIFLFSFFIIYSIHEELVRVFSDILMAFLYFNNCH